MIQHQQNYSIKRQHLDNEVTAKINEFTEQIQAIQQEIAAANNKRNTMEQQLAQFDEDLRKNAEKKQQAMEWLDKHNIEIRTEMQQNCIRTLQTLPYLLTHAQIDEIQSLLSD